MSLYIGGVSYSGNTYSTILEAINKLPSPFPDVRYDFDHEAYTLQPSRGKDFLITPKIGNILTDTIQGKDGYVFSKQSRMDEEAYYVCQGSMGIVISGKIGTRNIQDCVGLIIQDKKTHLTALAHISRSVDEDNIKKMLSKMPMGDKEVILIGGRYDDGKYNVEKILRVLENYEFNVFINTSYISNDSYIHDERLDFMQSCYELNTGLGDIVVNVSDLSVKVANPGGSILSQTI